MANYVSAATLAEAVSPGVRDVLDIGCGTAALSSWLADHLSARLHLHDNDPQVLQLAREAFDPASTSLQWSDVPQADLVTAMEVIEHVPYSGQLDFVKHAFSHVNPGGLLVVSTPDETSYPTGSSGYPPHIGTLSLPELRRLLQEATGREPVIWRLEGGAFHLSTARKYAEWFGNRLLSLRATQRGIQLAPRRADRTLPGRQHLQRLSAVRIAEPAGAGTGLIGLVSATD